MTPGELAEIEARVAAAADEWHTSDDVRELAADVPNLLAAVRERDNTIAKVREVAEEMLQCGSLLIAQGKAGLAISAALDPQETP